MAERDEEVEHVEMSFGDHLEELRRRLVRAILATLLAFCIVFYWREPVLAFVVEPFTDIARDLRLNALLNLRSPTDAFFSYMKVSLIVGILCSAPVWMWQFWAFVGAGLYDHEKKAVYRFVPPMVLLFGAGVSFGYAVLIPIGLRYLLSFADPSYLQNWIGLSEYLSLFTTLTLVLGIVFELPVVMALLAKIGLVGSRTFREKRRYFILTAFIVGAILTPPDAVTQVLMATPLCLLFEFGIFCAWMLEEDREPIHWKVWRRRGLLAALALLVLFFFQSEIVSSYRARLVGQRIRRIEEPTGEGLPYFKIFHAMKSLPFEPELVFQIIPTEERELLVAGRGPRAMLLDLGFNEGRIIDMSDDGRTARFLVSSAAHSVTVERVAEMKGEEFMGLLVMAIEQAGDDDLPALSAMAAGLVGEDPPGVRPLLEDDDDGARDAVRKSWRAWWEKSAATFVYRQETAR